MIGFLKNGKGSLLVAALIGAALATTAPAPAQAQSAIGTTTWGNDRTTPTTTTQAAAIGTTTWGNDVVAAPATQSASIGTTTWGNDAVAASQPSFFAQFKAFFLSLFN